MRAPASVIVTSCGRRVGLVQIFQQVMERLGSGGAVVGVDASPLAAAAHVVDRFHVVPRCDDPSYIEVLLGLARAEGAALLVPTIDTELPVLAAHRNDFAARGVLVGCSTPETIAISADKLRTWSFLRDHGFATVETWDAAEVEDPESLPLPLLAKPVRGSASIGVERVSSRERLADFLREGFVLQEIACGLEYTVDVYVTRAGEVRGAVPRRRIETRGGEVSKGVTVRLPPAETIAREVVRALPGAFGPLNVQLFHDAATGSVKVIEINARFGGGYPLTDRAGAPMARWLVDEALGRVPEPPDDWEADLLMLRYDDAVFVPGHRP